MLKNKLNCGLKKILFVLLMFNYLLASGNVNLKTFAGVARFDSYTSISDEIYSTNWSVEFWLQTKQIKTVFFDAYPINFGITENKELNVTLGSSKEYISSKIIADGKWHHIAVTFNKDLQELKIYIDGSEDTPTRNKDDDFNDMLYYFSIGYSDIKVDELRIWDYDRNASEIEENYNIPFSLPQN